MSETVLPSQFQPIPAQKAAIDLVKSSAARFFLFHGGSRSGKSVVISFMILIRAMQTPGSRHGIFRRTAVSCKDTLFNLAFRKAADLAFPGFLTNPKNCTINKQDMVIELSNGSVISFNGFDDSNRDRVLGGEYETIWMNECTDFIYDDFETLSTRLSGTSKTQTGKTIRPIMFLDLNPDVEDFMYNIWVESLDPARNTPIPNPEDYARLHMNLAEDATHVAAGYLDMLKNRSPHKVQRFVDGWWRKENENALFRPTTISKHRVLKAPDDLVRIVVAVDPAITGTASSDETGIVIAGVDEAGHIYVLGDRSLKGSPLDWAEAATSAYNGFNADRVIAERNQGGDMVESTLRNVSPNLPITLIYAWRGKFLRAEPVSALYDEGKVHHVGEFTKLEEQMSSFHSGFDRKRHGSPDRLDALVYAISELSGEVIEPTRGYASRTSLW